MKHLAQVSKTFLLISFVALAGCKDDLPRTADEFNAASNRLELTEILLTSPDEYKQYNDKFWCYHKKNQTDVWEKGRKICESETATSPNCNAVMGGTIFCGAPYKPTGKSKKFNSGF